MDTRACESRHRLPLYVDELDQVKVRRPDGGHMLIFLDTKPIFRRLLVSGAERAADAEFYPPWI